MNILLAGGSGSLINDLIIKLKKEGHRVYLLTGNRFSNDAYQAVFERYNFNYDSASLHEIFESVTPDVTIFLGAHDTNFTWKNPEAETTRYITALSNLLMSQSGRVGTRFVYLSSEEVYGKHSDEDITEETPTCPVSIRGIALAQAEQICDSYRNSLGMDVVTLRLDHLYNIPNNYKDVRSICATMCLEALQENRIEIVEDHTFSMLYQTDAIEFIYKLTACNSHEHSLYHVSTSAPITERQLAEMVASDFGTGSEILVTGSADMRLVLSNKRYDSEFGNPFFCDMSGIVYRIVQNMQRRSNDFLTDSDPEEGFWAKAGKKFGWLLKIIVPFIEALVLFVPFYLLNRVSADSRYFEKLDFFLLYVLLFAVVHGQQQAAFTALLSVIGFIYWQYTDNGVTSVLLDGNTYVWIALLFIIGLTVGYMRDTIKKLKEEREDEKDFLKLQLGDIKVINSSNVRVKDALQAEIVNQNDSVGKIYQITSALDQYSPEEVLFYAADMLAKMLKTKDVAIYNVSNADYARLFSATSKKARSLGPSIKYSAMEEFYDTLAAKKVFINRRMDDRYPLMANAIFDGDKMNMIVMVWGISWESMTLGTANQLQITSALIQNATVRANRYLEALEDDRYVDDTRLLETEAFESLYVAYSNAKAKELTEATLLRVDFQDKDSIVVGKELSAKMRLTDYLGFREDGKLYALLPNTSREDAVYVMKRFAEVGYSSEIVEEEKA